MDRIAYDSADLLLSDLLRSLEVFPLVDNAAAATREKFRGYAAALEVAAEAFTGIVLGVRDSYVDNYDFQLAVDYSFRTPNSLDGQAVHRLSADLQGTSAQALAEVTGRHRKLYVDNVLKKLVPDVLSELRNEKLAGIKATIAAFFNDEHVKLSAKSPWQCLFVNTARRTGTEDELVAPVLLELLERRVCWKDSRDRRGLFDISDAKTMFMLLDLARLGFSNVFVRDVPNTAAAKKYSMVQLLKQSPDPDPCGTLNKELKLPAWDTFCDRDRARTEALKIITCDDVREKVKTKIERDLDTKQGSGSCVDDPGVWQIRPGFIDRYGYGVQTGEEAAGVFEDAATVSICYSVLTKLCDDRLEDVDMGLQMLFRLCGNDTMSFTTEMCLNTLSLPMRVHAESKQVVFFNHAARLDEVIVAYIAAIHECSIANVQTQLHAAIEMSEYSIHTKLVGHLPSRTVVDLDGYDDKLLRGNRVVSTHLTEHYFREFADSMWLHGTYEFLYEDPVLEDTNGGRRVPEKGSGDYSTRMQADALAVASEVEKFVKRRVANVGTNINVDWKLHGAETDINAPRYEIHSQYPKSRSRIIVPISVEVVGVSDVARTFATNVMRALYPHSLDHFEYLPPQSNFAPPESTDGSERGGGDGGEEEGEDEEGEGMLKGKNRYDPETVDSSYSDAEDDTRDTKEKLDDAQKAIREKRKADKRASNPVKKKKIVEVLVFPLGVRKWRVKWWAGDASLAGHGGTPLPSRMSNKQIHTYVGSLIDRPVGDDTATFNSFNDCAMPLIDRMGDIVRTYRATIEGPRLSKQVAAEGYETLGARVDSSNRAFKNLMAPQGTEYEIPPVQGGQVQQQPGKSNIYDMFGRRSYSTMRSHYIHRDLTKRLTSGTLQSENVHGLTLQRLVNSRRQSLAINASKAFTEQCNEIINDLYRMGVIFNNVDVDRGTRALQKSSDAPFLPHLRAIDQNEPVKRRSQTYMSNVVHCVNVLKQDESDEGVVIDAFDDHLMPDPGGSDNTLPGGLYDLFDALETSAEFLSYSLRFLNTIQLASVKIDKRKNEKGGGKDQKLQMPEEANTVLKILTKYFLELSDEFQLGISRLLPACRSRSAWFDAGFCGKDHYLSTCARAIEILQMFKTRWNVGKLGVFVAMVGKFKREFRRKNHSTARIEDAAKWIKLLIQRVVDIDLGDLNEKLKDEKLADWLDVSENGYFKAAAALHTSAMMAMATRFAGVVAATPRVGPGFNAVFDTIRSYDEIEGSYKLHWKTKLDSATGRRVGYGSVPDGSNADDDADGPYGGELGGEEAGDDEGPGEGEGESNVDGDPLEM